MKCYICKKEIEEEVCHTAHCSIPSIDEVLFIHTGVCYDKFTGICHIKFDDTQEDEPVKNRWEILDL